MMEYSSYVQPTKLKGFRAFFHVLRRFLKYLLPFWDKILLRIIMSQCVAFLSVASIMTTANIIDRAFPQHDKRLLFFWIGFALVLHIAVSGFGLLNLLITWYVMMRLDLRFKTLMLKHVQKLSFRFHGSRPVGENMFRIHNDTFFATDLVGNFIPETIERLQGIATTLGAVLLLNPLIACLIGVYMVLYFVYAHSIATFAHDVQKRWRARYQEVTAVLQENLSSFVLSKAFSRERHESRRYYGRMAGATRAFVSWGIALALYGQGAPVLQASFYAFAYTLLCGYFVIKGRMTVGEYAAMFRFMWSLTVPLEYFVLTFERMRISAVPAERMLDTLELEPEVADVPRPIRLVRPKGEIVFENVFFRYTPNGRDVVRGLSFRVEPGQKLAIVGPSGAGKTSVFNLLMRFYDPVKGRILIDGNDLRTIALRSYRDQVSLVLQENFLFSATIRDNILFGNIHATEEQLRDAIRRSGLDEFIRELPGGLDTVLAEGGNISAGQKQRIAIGRAVIRNPRFLYLDEATSLLDPPTEREILAQLREVEAGRTRVIIAHNIASIRDADEILVLDDGLLVQRGTHETLLAEDGLYRRMWIAEEEKREREPASAGVT